MNAIGGDQHIEVATDSVLELHLDAISVIAQSRQAMADVHALVRDRRGERVQQVGAVHLVVREAECGFERRGQGRAQQRPAIVPAALVPGHRSHARQREVLGESEAMQDAGGVRTDLHAGPDFAQRGGLLEDVDVEAVAQERQRRGESADPSADDAHGGHIGRDDEPARPIPAAPWRSG